MEATSKPAGVLTFNPGSASMKWAYFPSLQAASSLAAGEAGPLEDDGAGVLPANCHAELAIIRFVHGGPDLFRPLEIDKHTVKKLQAAESLAPLHNRTSLLLSRRITEHAPAMKQIAVFDTAFFHNLPRISQLYGLPRALVDKYGIRRFGFHGFAHEGMVRAWRDLRKERDARPQRLVTAHLGSGCSMAAILDGRPMDTTMGFTPNEGLLMSTRCGDIDPGLVTWLQHREGWSPKVTDRELNEQSGWLGMSGESANMADLLESSSWEAAQTIDLFIHRIRKTLGAYYALLGGLDGVIFSGGISERAPDFCKRIISGLEHLGIHTAPAEPAPALTDKAGIPASRLTLPDSPAACWCAHSDEHRSMLDSVNNHLETDVRQ